MAKIYVCTHKRFSMPQIDGYIPLHVGRAGKADLGYVGDDTGDSISELNCYYGELTGLYWIWKNVHDGDNVGICHYRRYFGNDMHNYMNSGEFDEILKSYDIITPTATFIDDRFNSYRESYADAHCAEDLDMTGDIIKELYPDDYEAFVAGMNSKRCYFGNLFCTRKDIYDNYCEWLFGIFDILKNRIDFNKYPDDYHRRVFGFISEQLLMVWIIARKLKVFEGHVYLTDEKAETKELKLAVGQLIKTGQLNEAAGFYTEVLKVRPDIRLEQSDTNGDAALIEPILYILLKEQEAGIQGMAQYSSDLSTLLTHTKNVLKIIKEDSHFAADKDANALIQANEYLQSTHMSTLAVEVLAKFI